MAKRRLKKTVRSIIFSIFFGVSAIFLLLYFDLWDKVSEYINEKTIITNKVFVYEPKLKIINEKSDSRPIAVSINNHHDAWPHYGLQDAYLVYELIAEGGISRLIAIYKDKELEQIGSVRSARHYFLDYVLENDAIFVHIGYSPQAQSDIQTLGINNINGLSNTTAFFRDKSLNRAYEHTAFTKMSGIKKSITNYKYRSTSNELLLNYSPYKIDYDSDDTVKDAHKVDIVYSTYTSTSYVYDEENMVYKLYMSNKEHVDGITKKQYTVKNIITYQVKNTLVDSKGRQNLDNIGSGKGYYISNGKAINITWEKKSRSSKTIYKDSNGKELVVNDGNTWIHIQPSGGKLTIE